ncbi:MAG: hypothetical protein AB1942_14885, partial [Pseudomonadota bacterium]
AAAGGASIVGPFGPTLALRGAFAVAATIRAAFLALFGATPTALRPGGLAEGQGGRDARDGSQGEDQALHLATDIAAPRLNSP